MKWDFRICALNNLRFMTHMYVGLSDIQSAPTYAHQDYPPMLLPLAHLPLPRPHNDSSFNWIFAAAAATKISKKKKKRQKNTTKKKEKTRIAIFDRRLSLGFILRYFTRLWRALAAFFPSFFSGFSLQLALSFWRCYFSVTKFTFHTFITFGSCN